ncbi:DUF1350 family protein [Prochlorococcus marinus]|uniref:DUF1350 family protein n=1 Tax=Prochlorococcus marinus TaxID=1219 RepID=UPI0022B5A7C4|nr:DUF1350 family protein [Prochlorococcus marinus]
MTKWRRINQTWCKWPANPTALIEMIGGSYLATSPHISYKKLLERLAKKNNAIHAWSYIPNFDHQEQSNQAWRNLRECREILESRVGKLFNPIRLGHSLGCKLHLLAPDGGRKSEFLVSISFNNFKADRSIPMLRKLKRKFNIETEFSPNPDQTMSLISNKYIQANNLLIKFNADKLDQSELLLSHLKKRINDSSKIIEIKGDHLSPIGTGIKEVFSTKSANFEYEQEDCLQDIIDTIYEFKQG